MIGPRIDDMSLGALPLIHIDTPQTGITPVIPPFVEH